MAVPMGIIALPIILVQIVNMFELEEFMIGALTIPRLPAYRASEIETFKIKYFAEALRSIFVGDRYLFDSIPNIYNLYAITIPLFIIGFADAVIKLVKGMRSRKYDVGALALLWFLVVLIFESHIIPYTYRINAVFYVTVVLSVQGIVVIKNKLSNEPDDKSQNKLSNKFRKLYPALFCGIGIIYTVCAVRFCRFYFFKYTDATFPLPYFGTTFNEAVELIEGNEKLKNKLTFVSELGIYYALSSQISPYDFDISGDECIHWNNYWFGSLQEISDDCNYIVYGNFEEYCEDLRRAGFTEERFGRYSVFYKE